MRKTAVRAEEIYDALIDDESFSALPVRLAEGVGARSGLIHWVHRDGSGTVMAHSNYFSDVELQVYSERFLHLDPWLAAAHQGAPTNVAINLDDFVPLEAYVRSTFFNEMIVGFGDDTARCMGIRVENEWGSGFMAFQRGITQPAFDRSAVAALDRLTPHVRRLLSTRGRLAGAQRTSAHVAGMVDALAQATLLVTGEGRLLHANASAEELLRAGTGLCMKAGCVATSLSGASRHLDQAIAAAASPTGPAAGALAVRCADGRTIELSVVPVAAADGRRHVLILATDPVQRDDSLGNRLRTRYGLSPVEVQLAVRLAEGDTIAEVAAARRTSEGTVRLQVKRLMEKLDCRRQAEVVRIVKSLPLFHNGNGS